MSTKQIDVTCPCCSTRLTVDVLTRQVLRQTRPTTEAPESGEGDPWDSAQARVWDRSKSGEGKLDDALEHERGKSARFDELFDKARAKHAKKPDEES